MNTRRQSWKERMGIGEGGEAPRGFGASFSTADSTRPPTPGWPTDPHKPPGSLTSC